MVDFNTFIVSVDEIIPGLWLGNEAVSQSEEFVRSHNIGMIVNATKNVHSKFLGKVHYIRVPVDDPGILGRVQQDNEDVKIMKEVLPYVLTRIALFRKHGKPVLIHCHAGAQRSAIIAAAYLLHRGYAKSSDEAIHKIIQKRSIAFFGGDSVNFAKAL
jgi:rhodanese-related sulfurtransferase